MCLGFHLSIAGSLRRAIDQARVLGCQALQILCSSPGAGNGALWRWWQFGIFVLTRGLAGLDPLVVHLGYLPNLATADPDLYSLSTERLWR